MKEAQVDALVKIGSVAVGLLIDYLAEPPKTDADRAAQDRAAAALVEQASRVGDAVRARLSFPDDSATEA